MIENEKGRLEPEQTSKKERDANTFAREDTPVIIDLPRSYCRGMDGVRRRQRYNLDGGTTIVEERTEFRQQKNRAGSIPEGKLSVSRRFPL
jgi:hypothetical protein